MRGPRSRGDLSQTPALLVANADRQPHVDLGIKDPRDEAHMLEQIMRVVPLASHASYPETDRGYRYSNHATQVAVAAQLGYVQLVNPVGSGIFVYVDQIMVDAQAAARALIGLAAPAGALVSQGVRHALSQTAVRTGLAQLRSGSQAGILGFAWRVYPVAANTGHFVLPPNLRAGIRLPEGFGISIQLDVVNTQVGVAFDYLEVPQSAIYALNR